MLTPYIEKLMQGTSLTESECEAALSDILNSTCSIQTAAFLVLLHAKQETATELLAFVRAMRAEMIAVTVPEKTLDIVGTGGDGANTLNFSTAASLVVASCGFPVVKHGNRSVSSRCGAADVLEAWGVNIHLNEEAVVRCLEKARMAFCFAPYFHPAMRALVPLRKKLGVRTTFNLLGPLLNPARADFYVMGVFDPKYLTLFAEVLSELACERALVVHGSGLDELSCLGPATVIEVSPHQQKPYEIDPKAFGLSRCTLSDLQGGTPEHNALQLRHALQGERGPVADTIALNAGAGLYVMGATKTIAQGVEMAQAAMALGQPDQVLATLIAASQQETRFDA